MKKLLIPIFLASCAPAAVDTVQPNAIAKSAFEGEWFWRDAVVEVPYGSAATFTGAEGELERIRWSIEEDYLIGYRSYEQVENADIPYEVGIEGEEYYGAPLIAYGIEKHFDIRRGYDRTTGEENNVIQENTEQDWQDRAFMRVDFSTNLVDVSVFSAAGVQVRKLDLYSQDPADEYALQFDDSNADGVLDHFALHTRVLAEPDSVRFPGYGDIPVCFFYGEAHVECGATEVVIRSDFMRVDDNRDYAGQDYDDRWMSTFGFFETERLSYDEAYGIAEENRVWYANRHNLFDQWFERDGQGRILCKVDKQVVPCESTKKADNPKPVQMDVRDRPVKPIVYHVSHNFDPALKSELSRLEAEWDAPFTDTVNQLRYWACIDSGTKAKKCEDAIDPNLQMFVICENNPSLPSDPAVCSTDHTGPNGVPDGVPDIAEIGDLRYSFISWIADPQLASPFGYGPSAADPVGQQIQLADGKLRMGAGEILSGDAHIFGAVLERVAQSTLDLVRVINGDLSESEFADGEHVDAWVEAVRRGETPGVLAGRVEGQVEEGQPEDPARAADILARLDVDWGAPMFADISNGPAPVDVPSHEARLEHVRRVLDASPAATAGVRGAAAWQELMDSDFDSLLWNDETIGALGYDPSIAGAGVIEAHSPLELLDPSSRESRRQAQVLAGKHAVDMNDGLFSDPSLMQLARRYAEAGMSYAEVLEDVRKEWFVAVMLHEVGHTVGLRHNFAGSYDAWNFDETYWELRDDGNLAPRHVDPLTDAEIAGAIHEHEYSSIMDYHGNYNGDWHGLGRWDRAAVKFGYGQLVEVMSAVPDGQAISGVPNDEMVGLVSYFGSSDVYPIPILAYTDGSFVEFHYTDYPAIAGDLQARVDVPFKYMEGIYEPEIATSKRSFEDMLYVANDIPGVIDAGAPAAPYRFCSDEFAGAPVCNRFDAGADPYEVNQFLTNKYWDWYLMNNFKNGKYGFSTSNAYLHRLMDRTFDPIHTWLRYYVLFHQIYSAGFDENAVDYFASDKGLGGWTIAADESFQFFTRVITRPEAGGHAIDYRADGVEVAKATWDAGDFELPMITGAYYESDWQYDAGYRWYEKQSRIGTYWDKMLALQVLTSTSPYSFVGYDTTADPRTYALGYANLFETPLSLFLAQLLADDITEYAPVFTEDDELLYPDLGDVGRIWPPPEGDIVQPGAYWLVQYSAGIFSKALLREGFDMTFLNRSRIVLEGGSDDVTLSGIPIVSFTDPNSGLTWLAASYPAVGGEDEVALFDGDGDLVELGSGAAMLRRAEKLARLCTLEEWAPYTDPDDADSVAWQEQLTCETLDDLVADIQLQAEVYGYFNR